MFTRCSVTHRNRASLAQQARIFVKLRNISVILVELITTALSLSALCACGRPGATMWEHVQSGGGMPMGGGVSTEGTKGGWGEDIPSIHTPNANGAWSLHVHLCIVSSCEWGAGGKRGSLCVPFACKRGLWVNGVGVAHSICVSCCCVSWAEGWVKGGWGYLSAPLCKRKGRAPMVSNCASCFHVRGA